MSIQDLLLFVVSSLKNRNVSGVKIAALPVCLKSIVKLQSLVGEPGIVPAHPDLQSICFLVLLFAALDFARYLAVLRNNSDQGP
jgi:hypothetical protein